MDNINLVTLWVAKAGLSARPFLLGVNIFKAFLEDEFCLIQYWKMGLCRRGCID